MFSNESGFPPHTQGGSNKQKMKRRRKKKAHPSISETFIQLGPAASRRNEVREDGKNSKGPPPLHLLFYSSQSSLFVFPRRMVPPTSLFIGTKLPFPDPPPKILQFSHCSFRMYPPPFFAPPLPSISITSNSPPILFRLYSPIQETLPGCGTHLESSPFLNSPSIPSPTGRDRLL